MTVGASPAKITTDALVLRQVGKTYAERMDARKQGGGAGGGALQKQRPKPKRGALLTQHTGLPPRPGTKHTKHTTSAGKGTHAVATQRTGPGDRPRSKKR